ncbi:MAG: NADPH-dependent FMN reductase [Acidimicrobiia bacterium]
MLDPEHIRPVHVLAFAGSLRRGSYNRALVRAAMGIAPAGLEVRAWELDGVPLYNGDVEIMGDPPTVVAFKQAIGVADALLIATPEYQHGVPGVLKNALDWASRPAGRSALEGKVVGIMGASPGIGGTARAQSQLRQTLVFNDCEVIGPPEVLVRDAARLFGPDLQLRDEETLRFVRRLLGRIDRAVRRRWTVEALDPAHLPAV